MSASDAYENSAALLFFNATTWEGIAVNDTTGPLTNLECSLHTADPGEAGSQTTSEIAYTDYARVAQARSGAGWTVSANVVNPAANIDFPVGGGGSGTATYLGIGSAHTAAGILYMSGAMTPSVVCGSGVTPRINTATAITFS